MRVRACICRCVCCRVDWRGHSSESALVTRGGECDGKGGLVRVEVREEIGRGQTKVDE